MFIYSKSTPHNQEFILEYKCDDILGEVFLDQVCQLWGGDQGTRFVVLREVQPTDLDHTLVAVTETSSQKIDLIIPKTCDGSLCPNPRKTMEFLPPRVLSILV